MAEQAINDVEAVLASTIDGSVTSLALVDATGYPTTGDYRIRVDDELMKVTGGSGVNRTVVRAQEGTAAAAHLAGASVEIVQTAASLPLIIQQLIDASVVVPGIADVTGLSAALALLAPLASPTFTGDPRAPTAATGDSDTTIATSALVDAKIAAAIAILSIPEADVTGLIADLSAKAPLASPALTGVPTAPTAAGGTNTTQLATTAFVIAQLASIPESGVTGLVADLALAFKRAIGLGVAGTVAATLNDGADFWPVVPFDATVKQMYVSTKTAPGGAMAVQLRRSTDGGATFGDVSGFVATFVAAAHTASVDPADVNVNAGDVLNLSVTTGSGANLAATVNMVPR